MVDDEHWTWYGDGHWIKREKYFGINAVLNIFLMFVNRYGKWNENECKNITMILLNKITTISMKIASDWTFQQEIRSLNVNQYIIIILLTGWIQFHQIICNAFETAQKIHQQSTKHWTLNWLMAGNRHPKHQNSTNKPEYGAESNDTSEKRQKPHFYRAYENSELIVSIPRIASVSGRRLKSGSFKQNNRKCRF